LKSIFTRTGEVSQSVAMICGITGQDGAYLARFLLDRGYAVFGTSRDAHMSTRSNLIRLGIEKQVTVVSMALNDFRSVLHAIAQIEPTEIYNLAGQTSVSLSFDQPVETLESISAGTINLLECIRILDLNIRFYNAGSSECFGNTGVVPATEETPFKPRSPYAVAKAAAFWQVNNYREAYDLFACSGILYNHESPLRPERFVTQKIVRAACEIALGREEKLMLGNLDIERDWGWAPEYVEAMWMMLQRENPEDFLVATGQSYSLEAFVEKAFSTLDLDWQDYVVSDSSLLRPTDLKYSRAAPHKANDLLGWTATYAMPQVVKNMVNAEMEKINTVGCDAKL